MRADVVPGAIFPNYELPDHTGQMRTLCELRGDDPLIQTLARDHYCPKEHQQHLGLAVDAERRARRTPPRSLSAYTRPWSTGTGAAVKHLNDSIKCKKATDLTWLNVRRTIQIEKYRRRSWTLLRP